eukprot:GHVL01025791.1.p1 GENE.GHVL01025791.1~~GHVL01025791.1.p1  ORF type:complete len:271 (+),score=66.63 GHVL01025791.1:22-813(+)
MNNKNKTAKDINNNKTVIKNEHILQTNHLHIWPRYTYMMIALPNIDYTFTCTLFLPLYLFNILESSNNNDILLFFKNNFYDFYTLLGEESLLKQFHQNPSRPLSYIKCDPFAFEKCCLLGDAAHAMVPFLGQGMNSGFEDCRIISEKLKKNMTPEEIQLVCLEYAENRPIDTDAIQELSLSNYVEMRSHVTSPIFQIRSYIDKILFFLIGSRWTPMYSMIAFTNTRYSEIIKKRKSQDNTIKISSILICFAIITFVAKKILKK